MITDAAIAPPAKVNEFLVTLAVPQSRALRHARHNSPTTMSGMSQLQYFLVPFPEGASSRSVNVQAALKLLRIEGSLACQFHSGF